MYLIELNPDKVAHLIIIENMCKIIKYLPLIKLVYGNFDHMSLYDNDKLITKDGNEIIDSLNNNSKPYKDTTTYNNSFLNSIHENITKGKSVSDVIAAEQELDKLELTSNDVPNNSDRFVRDMY